jgi:hypothetical protein
MWRLVDPVEQAERHPHCREQLHDVGDDEGDTSRG